MVAMVPTIIERWNQGAAVGYDIFSRLLKDRIIFVGGYDSTEVHRTAAARRLVQSAQDPRARGLGVGWKQRIHPRAPLLCRRIGLHLKPRLT